VTHGRYRVTGRRQYRGHEPGTVFEALIDGGAELRAIGRGDIELLERVTPSVKPGSFALPDPWPPAAATARQTEAPQGASRI